MLSHIVKILKTQRETVGKEITDDVFNLPLLLHYCGLQHENQVSQPGVRHISLCEAYQSVSPLHTITVTSIFYSTRCNRIKNTLDV